MSRTANASPPAIDLHPAPADPTAAFIRQRWEHLLFLHWRMRKAQLVARLPPGLRLDTHQGHAYAGLVPFTVSLNRLHWLPAPVSPPFHEVNLRTYVRGPCGEPAVWFFSLDSSSRMAALGGAALFSLPYRHARIRFSHEVPGAPGGRDWISFESRRVPDDPPDCAVRYSPAGLPRTATTPGTLEHFLIERSVLYAWTGARLVRARVNHEPYEVQDAQVEDLHERLFTGAGLSRPSSEPLAHYSRGLTVDISRPRRQEP